jgi:enolase
MGKALVFGDEGGWAGAWDREESLMRFMDSVKREARLEADFGFDIAANNVSAFEPKSYLKRYLDLISAYPIIFIEDPFPEEGYESFYQDLYRAAAKTTLIVGDDLIATNPSRIKHFVAKKAINAIIVKPDQVGTLTETIAGAELARKSKWSIAVAHRAEETIDDYLADLAIGLRAEFVKFGYFYQGERLAKYNRLLEIEERFG